MTTQARKTLLSGMQPTNRLHIGNLIGALRNWVKLQDEFDCLFMAVDLHAITTRQDPATLREQTLRALATYVAAGIDPAKSTLFVQSQVPQHAELGWILTCHATMGELSRMTQYKDKSQRHGESIPAGLFVYPALMAADILLYQAALVPVGGDQKQHLELTRDLAIRMNGAYPSRPLKEGDPDPAPLFRVPEGYIPPVGARVMSLQQPTAKMSKSDSDENGAVFLGDSDDQIRKKLKRAVTDSGSEILFDVEQKPGVSNLLSIQAALTGKSIESLVESYRGRMYGHLKVDTAEIVVTAVAPIRDEAERILRERTHLEAILARGAEQARQRAEATLKAVYERIGFLPRRPAL